MARPRTKAPPEPVAWGNYLSLAAMACVVAFYLVSALLMARSMPTLADGPAYSRYTPPDEGAHIGYVTEMLTNRSLPRFSTGSGNYEAHQPPLYYLSSIPLYLIMRADGSGGGRYWGLRSDDYKTMRLMSVLWGLAALIAAFYLGRMLFPGSRLLQVALPAALAALPSRTFICASFSNDAASEFFSIVALVLAIGGIQRGFDLRRAGWLGLAVALGLLSKTTCLALVPVAGAAVLLDWAIGRKLTWRQVLAQLGLMAGIVALLWGWWLLRNISLYGDPLAARAFKAIFSKDRTTPAYFLDNPRLHFTWLLYFQMVFKISVMTLWGLYGQVAAYMPALYYTLGRVMSYLMGLGLVVALLSLIARKTVVSARTLAVWGLMLLLLAVVLVDFVGFNLSFFQSQSRYMFPANAVLAAIFVASLAALGGWRRLPGRWVALAAVVLLVLSATSLAYVGLGLSQFHALYQGAALPAALAVAALGGAGSARVWGRAPLYACFGVLIAMTAWSLAAMSSLSFGPVGLY